MQDRQSKDAPWILSIEMEYKQYTQSSFSVNFWSGLLKISIWKLQKHSCSAAILCSAVCICDMNKVNISGRSIMFIMSLPFSTPPWERADQYGRTWRSSNWKQKKVLLLQKYWQDHYTMHANGNIYTFSASLGQLAPSPGVPFKPPPRPPSHPCQRVGTTAAVSFHDKSWGHLSQPNHWLFRTLLYLRMSENWKASMRPYDSHMTWHMTRQMGCSTLSNIIIWHYAGKWTQRCQGQCMTFYR